MLRVRIDTPDNEDWPKRSQDITDYPLFPESLTASVRIGISDGVMSFACDAHGEFACTSRLCAPPPVGRGGSLPSGGSSGSSPRGAVSVSGRASAPRGTKTAKGSKAAKEKDSSAGKSTFRRTAFTKKIEDAIKAEPALMRAPSSHEIQKRVAEQRKIDLETNRQLDIADIKSRGMRVSSGYMNGGDVKRAIAREVGIDGADTMSVAQLVSALDSWHRDFIDKFMGNPTMKLSNRIEEGYAQYLQRLLPDEYEDTVRMSDRLSRGLSDAQVYLNDIIGADPSRPWDKYSIDLGGTTRRMPQAKPIKWDEGIDSEYAAASQRVGKIVHEEFTQRLQQNRESARAKVEKDVESLLAVVSKSMSEKFGYEFVATPKNVEMSLYNGKVSLTVYPDGRGITSTSYDFDTTTIPREIFVEFVGSGLRSADPDFEVRRALKGMVQRTFMEVMEEIRPMGGAFAGVPKHRKTVGGMSANEQLTAIAKLYPSDWIDASNILGEVSYRLSSGRQHYDQHKKEVTLDKGDLSTGVHEVGHRMEDSVPGLAAMERLFFERRTFGEVKIPLRKLQPKSKYRNNEYSKPDKFFHPYAGKEYSDGFYEIFTMGMEEVAMGAGRNVGGKGTIDDDYSSFMFGVLATLYREPM